MADSHSVSSGSGAIFASDSPTKVPGAGVSGTTTVTGDNPPSLRHHIPNPVSFGRYVVESHLGSGGMGEVWRVRDPLFHRTLALKVIRAELSPADAELSRFVQEAQVVAQLQHPGIVPVHDLGRLPDGRYFYTMKEVRGRSLKDVIARVHAASSLSSWGTSEESWSLRRMLEAFHQVCQAVAYAHSVGVIHRDLKPSNIMIGAFGEVLVMDWGLAKVCGVPGEYHPLTTIRTQGGGHTTLHGKVEGTLSYMPPEQFAGRSDDICFASDVYALGATLYHILAGVPPYSGFSGQQLLARVAYSPPQVLTEVVRLAGAPPLPDGLARLCEQAMAVLPTDRFKDAGEFAAAIGRWLEGARRREEAMSRVAEADQLRRELDDLRRMATELEGRAGQLARLLPRGASLEAKRQVWQAEDEARRLRQQAGIMELSWLQVLRNALTVEPDLQEAHERLADLYQQQQCHAELERDEERSTQFATLLRFHDRGRHHEWLRGVGSLTLVTDPPGAEVTLLRFEARDRHLLPEFVRTLGRTPIDQLELPIGSYLLKLAAPGRVVVSYPVEIRRMGRWDGVAPGEGVSRPVYLPREGEIDPREVYVPAGWFMAGGDAQAFDSPPPTLLWVEAFAIGRFPVTNREFALFLNDLVDQGRLEQAEQLAPFGRGGETVSQDQLPIRDEKGHWVPIAGGVWGPEQPVIHVVWAAAYQYARWLRERTGLPYRLPWEFEWEKAARGVDGRIFPWGNYLDANFAHTVESMSLESAGPASIYDFPLDESPYGVRGMGGNVRDWCHEQSLPGALPELKAGHLVPPVIIDEDPNSVTVLAIVRGGAWNYGPRSVRVAARARFSSTDNQPNIGFRLLRPIH